LQLAQRSRCFRLAALLLALIVSGQFSHGSDVLNPGEHFAAVNGVRLWYKVAGRGPILVIQAPGWGVGSTLLQRNLTPLERNFTLVYFDTRGSGKSSRPAEEIRMSTLDMADDLEAVRAYLGLEKIAVLGHSHGGQISSAFAAKRPDHVSSLVLVTSVPPKNPTPEFDAESKKIYDRLAKNPRYANAVKAVQEPFPDSDQEIGKWFERTAPLFWYDVSKARTLDGLPPFDGWAAASYGKAENQASYNLIPDLKKLSAPALIIEGKYDFIAQDFHQQVFKTNILHSRLVTLEQSGHFPFIEEPDKFFAVVTDFLRQ
jgi:pimeloyl-ACP methyl ester carboxylesterase